MNRKSVLSVLSLLMLVVVACAPNPEAAAPEEVSEQREESLPTRAYNAVRAKVAPQPPLIIPAGTAVSVRLQHAVSSASAQSGDAFNAVLNEPLVVNGKTIAPAGSEVTGRVVAARKSGRLHNSGYLRLALDSVTAADGAQIPVQTSTVFASGGTYTKRNTAMIGGGAAAGAIIGGIAGGGKGALIGSAIGAGGGTGVAYATGKKDVTFSAERSLIFKLTQNVTVRQ